MGGRKTIVAAVSDREIARDLERVISELGCRAVIVSDAQGALEAVALYSPQLIILDDSCRDLDIDTAFDALRTTPSTSHVAVVLLAENKIDDIKYFDRLRDVVFVKPYNLDEVASKMSRMLSSSTRDAGGQDKEQKLEGDIQQVGLPDLLQVFWTNKKSGVLELSGPRGRGRIFMHQGAPVHAETGSVSGEKALFRLLSWHNGRFVFKEGEPGGAQTLHGSPEAMIMEGVRQNDELERLRPSLPKQDDYLVLSVSVDALPMGMHPVTREAASLLERPMSFAELLDSVQATDYETAQAVLVLMERGLLRKVRESAPFRIPLLVEPQVVLALKTRMREKYHGRADRRFLKVILCSSRRGLVLDFLGSLASRPGFAKNSRLATRNEREARAIGTVGALRLDDATELTLWSAPAEAPLRPMWKPFMDGAFGVVFLVQPGDDGAAGTLYNAYDFFFGESGLPAVVVMPSEKDLGDELAFLDGLPIFRLDREGGAAALARLCRIAAERTHDVPREKEIARGNG